MSKYSAQGLLLQVEVASVFTTVAQCTNLDGPSDEVQFWDATCLESTDVEDGELADLTAPGEVSGTCFYDDANAVHAQMQTDIRNRGEHRNYQLVLPTTGTPAMAFEGSAKTFKPKGSVKGGLEADFAVKLRTPAAAAS